MAYELVLAGLRRAGLFVRRAGFLDRALSVRKIVFDKTGTLTTGALELVDDAALSALSGPDRQCLYDLAARSAHPKSQALARCLAAGPDAPRFDKTALVVEHPGRGLEAVFDGRLHRLGAPGWVLGDDPAGPDDDGADDPVYVVDSSDDPVYVVDSSDDLVYAVDGEVRARLETRETLRPDARREAERLRRAGYDLFVLSGDATTRARRLAASLGIAEDHALGDQRPEDKARWLEAHDEKDTLMLGDGINDAMAVDRAHCSGTPAVDRPFMPARTDFYLVTPGLAPLTLSLRASAALAQTVRRNLTFAVVYNLAMVGLAWAGLMQPWLAAVLMPLSSLLVLAATTWSLSARSALWKS
jgi:Cu2+-exporting ATPase